MKTLELQLPDQLAQAVDALVQSGWFTSTDEIARHALIDFVHHHRFDLEEQERLRPEESRSASSLEEPRPKAATALLELAGIGDSGLGDLGRRHDDYLAEDFDR